MTKLKRLFSEFLPFWDDGGCYVHTVDELLTFIFWSKQYDWTTRSTFLFFILFRTWTFAHANWIKRAFATTKCICGWLITVNVAPQRYGMNIKYRAVHRLFWVYGRNGVVGVFVFCLLVSSRCTRIVCTLVSPVIFPLPHPTITVGSRIG